MEDEKQKKDLRRIKNLLDLSKSDNSNEAELAAQRAAEMMAKLQISEAELGGFDTDELKIDEFTLEEAGQLTHWQARAAFAAAAAFGGQVYSSGDITRMDGSEYTRADFINKVPHKKRTRILFIGRTQDAQAVSYLYKFFCAEIRQLADAAFTTANRQSMNGLNARSWKDSFRKGCAARISERTNKRKKKCNNKSQHKRNSGS